MVQNGEYEVPEKTPTLDKNVWDALQVRAGEYAATSKFNGNLSVSLKLDTGDILFEESNGTSSQFRQIRIPKLGLEDVLLLMNNPQDIYVEMMLRARVAHVTSEAGLDFTKAAFKPGQSGILALRLDVGVALSFLFCLTSGKCVVFFFH